MIEKWPFQLDRLLNDRHNRNSFNQNECGHLGIGGRLLFMSLSEILLTNIFLTFQNLGGLLGKKLPSI